MGIGWGMCGRAEFAYYIAAGALTSLLMTKEVYAICIWSLICATVIAPFAFRLTLTRYLKMLSQKGKASFVSMDPESEAKYKAEIEAREKEEEAKNHIKPPLS